MDGGRENLLRFVAGRSSVDVITGLERFRYRVADAKDLDLGDAHDVPVALP
jgi:hypothetical protein